jgi:conjugative transfer region protein TrbK
LVVDQKILTRAIAVLVLAIAMVAAVARFGGMNGEGPRARQIQTERHAGPLAAELERCRAISLEAADDAECEAAWRENRERFFRTDRLPRQELPPKRQDRIGPTLLPEAPRTPIPHEAR